MMMTQHRVWLAAALYGCGAASGSSPAVRASEPVETAAGVKEHAAKAAPQATPARPQEARSTQSTPAAPEAIAAPQASAPTPCGAHGCLRFASPVDAFEHVLAEEPLVLAVGEMHQLAGHEAVASAVHRFTTELLPRLRGRASDLVLELWIADPDCEREVATVDEAQNEIRAGQAADNQNEYVALGDEAKRLGIQPSVLEPTCDDYRAIAAAGEDGVILMLQTIARLTADKVTALVDKHRLREKQPIVVSYGGAIHNDLDPAKSAISFSYGPALAKRFGRRYIALDLIVPELITDNKLWRAQPWRDAYDPTAHPDETILYHPRDGEYALIFPHS